jgi:23S rRNA (adenine2503-C2)-methyltransferase
MKPALLRTHVVDEVAVIYLQRLRDDPRFDVECVGASDPAIPRREKMVLVISSQYGCPVGCTTCDAGGAFHGNLTRDEILAQVAFLLERWAGPEVARCEKFKVQFARMGEPSLNPAVLEALEALPALVPAPGLMPCVATMAPRGREAWFESLLELRHRVYPKGAFQLQFSIQSSSDAHRDRMIPVPKWTPREIASYAERFVRPGDRRVSLNFAVARGVPVEPDVIADLFDPRVCMVKLTPLNFTRKARESGWESAFDHDEDPRVRDLAASLRARGFDCIVSVGLPAEARDSASCGQLRLLAVAGGAAHAHEGQAHQG